MSAAPKLAGEMPVLRVRAVAHEPGLARLRGMVLMAGTTRSGSFLRQIRRSVVDLPVGGGKTLLDVWLGEWRSVTGMLEKPELDVQLMLDREALAPRRGESAGVRVERDPKEFRGTGGALADMSRGLDPDDYLFVASAGQLPARRLTEVLNRLAWAGGGSDVALMANADETATGLMLVRCGALAEVSDVGFVDFKEQALPVIARRHSVTVISEDVVAHPIRTAGDYLWALRQHHRILQGRKQQMDGLEEDWRPTFSVVEEGAAVSSNAKVYDSVVLDGATVEDGAALVRTVVCGGGTVRARSVAIDEVVSETGSVRHTG